MVVLMKKMRRFNPIDWLLVLTILLSVMLVSLSFIYPRPWVKYSSEEVELALAIRSSDDEVTDSIMKAKEVFVAGGKEKIVISSKEKKLIKEGTYRIVYHFKGKGLKSKNIFDGQQFYVGQEVRIKENFLVKARVVSFE